MEEFLMKPKVDFAFKEITTNKKARIGFLSAILKIKPEDIKETILVKSDIRNPLRYLLITSEKFMRMINREF